MADLTKLKIILGLEDNSKDAVLEILYTNVRNAVELYIGQSFTLLPFPVELEWIVEEATVSRMNRLGSEGLKSENIDVIGLTYIEDVLDTYKPYLNAYVSRFPNPTSPKRLRML